MVIFGIIWGSKEMRKQNLKLDPPEQTTEDVVPTNTVTMECTSLAGTTMVFSLREFSNRLVNPPFYAAIDNHGVVVVINSENYGQWKCKE